METINGRKEDTAASHQKVGLLLFNSTGQLVFMNHEAQFFIRRLDPATMTKNGSHLVPEEVHALVDELTSQVMRCEHAKDCEAIQVERLCFSGNQRLLLRGLCIPDAPLPCDSHLLIVMEHIDQESETPDTTREPQYHFTEREQIVIIYLMLGFTNTEIANRLNITEHSIKEHLKRIMHKTQSTTRTGLLARMIFPHLNEGSGLRITCG